jgi:hypothetical protein
MYMGSVLRLAAAGRRIVSAYGVRPSRAFDLAEVRAENGQGELHLHRACGWISFRDAEKVSDRRRIDAQPCRWLLQALHNFLAAIA